MHYKIPLIFDPQPEGGYTVTSPTLPELVTEGDTVEDALENVRDAVKAVIELYHESGRALPAALLISDPTAPVGCDLGLMETPRRTPPGMCRPNATGP
jgi:antitoxin HicB